VITNDEVIQFLYSATASLAKGIDDEDIYRQLRGMLMADTKEGKLYKYRSFDKDGYSLSNLSSQTMYCSQASAFNDPFDCRMGVDYQSLAKDIADVWQEKADRFLLAVCQLRNGRVKLEDFSDADQEILSHWLDSEALNRLFDMAEVHPDVSHAEMEQYVVTHFQEFCDLLSPITGTASWNPLPESLLQKALEHTTDGQIDISGLARECGITDDADEITLGGLLLQYIDPSMVEKAVRAEAETNHLIQKIKSALDDRFYVGCLCNDYKNCLMWSHYADKHKGFCIEYDFSHVSDDMLPLPVIYSKKRVRMPWKFALDTTPENIAEANQRFLEALLTKDEIWQYENEWRILASPDAGHNLKMPPVSCIYLGALCSEENKKQITDIAAQLGVPVKRMKTDRGEYELHAQPVVV